MASRTTETAQQIVHFPSRSLTEKPMSGGECVRLFQFGEIIRSKRKERSLSQSDLAKEMNVTRNTIVNWETDRSKPEFDSIPRLCQALGIPVDTFFGFDRAPGLTAEEDQLVQMYRLLSPVGRKIAGGVLKTILDEECEAVNETYRTGYHLVSCLPDTAAAGSGDGYTDSRPSPVFVRNNAVSLEADAVIRVRGDSMEPVYHNGDYVYVRYAEHALTGEDVICSTADGTVIKRVNDKGQLYSINPALPFGNRYEDDHVKIRGKVLGVVSPEDIAREEDLGILNELFRDELRQFSEEHRLSGDE